MPAAITVITVGCVLMVCGLVLFAVGGVNYFEGLVNRTNYSVNSQWVAQFMNDTNSYRPNAPLAYEPSLDNFSQLRFNSMVQNYVISHYGFDQDVSAYFANTQVQIAVGEVVYFPTGHSPSDYLSYVEETSPGHWQVMMDSAYHYYGYYIGIGPTYQINQNCPDGEIPGPNINITRYLVAEGCTYTITNSTWLVIDFSSS